MHTIVVDIVRTVWTVRRELNEKLRQRRLTVVY